MNEEKWENMTDDSEITDLENTIEDLLSDNKYLENKLQSIRILLNDKDMELSDMIDRIEEITK